MDLKDFLEHVIQKLPIYGDEMYDLMMRVNNEARRIMA